MALLEDSFMFFRTSEPDTHDKTVMHIKLKENIKIEAKIIFWL